MVPTVVDVPAPTMGPPQRGQIGSAMCPVNRAGVAVTPCGDAGAMVQFVLSPTRRLSYNLVARADGQRVVTDAYLVHTDDGTAERLEPTVARMMLVDLGVLEE